jgi:hypothetical protein
MKTAILSVFLSFSALASTECYLRTEELSTTEVKMAKEVCIQGIELKLVTVGKSQAFIKYTLDGVNKVKQMDLSTSSAGPDGKVRLLANLESNASNWGCHDVTMAFINGELSMNRDGSNPVLSNIEGEVVFTPDVCHSPTEEIQTLPFVKVPN